MKIDVKGPIISDSEQWIYDWFGITATSPGRVSNEIRKAQNGEKIEVRINSGGGSVFSGSEIYSTLKEYEGEVEVKIVGLAASAASVIAMAGDKVLMSPTGQMMIHNSSTVARGDTNTFGNVSDMLGTVDRSIANAYRLKTGMEQEKLLGMMGKETWMGTQEALENRFIDGIMFDENRVLAASDIRNDGTLPPEVIEKIRNELKGIPQITNSMGNTGTDLEAKSESENQAVKAETEEIELLKAKLGLELELL